jgi:Adenosine deaminase
VTSSGPAELHAHLYGSVPPDAVLRHLADHYDQVDWGWYEEGFAAVYGTRPPTRVLVERFRAGDQGVGRAFAEVYVLGDDDAGDFARFSAKGRLVWATDDGTPARRDRIALGFAAAVRQDLARQGVAHAELRCQPSAALPAAFAGGSGPTLRMAVSLDRDDPWPHWERVAEVLLGPHGAAVTGIDFCGVEEGHPPADVADLFAAVRAFNDRHPGRAVAILDHVGESFTDKSMESAVRWVQEAAELGAHRLGHAIALGVDPAAFGPHTRTETVRERRNQIAYDLAHQAGLRAAGVVVDPDALRRELAGLAGLPGDHALAVAYDDDRLAAVRRRQDYAIERVGRTGAVVEVCPTSNRRIGGIADPAHHPVHRFLAADLPVVVGADDPGVFGVTLAQELDWVCEQVGGGAGLRDQLVEASWASRSEVLSGRAAAAAVRTRNTS